MKFEISFPDQPADEAGVLAQELRLALLRSGADPSKVEIKKERADTMQLGNLIEVGLEVVALAHFLQCLYGICVPAKSGIRIKAPRGRIVELKPSDVSFERLKQILDVLDSDENGG